MIKFNTIYRWKYFMFLFLFINFLVVIGVSKMKYDNHGLINDKKKKTNSQRQPVPKSFGIRI